MVGKTWLWWQLWLLIKPHLRSSKFAEIKATLEEKRQVAEKKIEGRNRFLWIIDAWIKGPRKVSTPA